MKNRGFTLLELLGVIVILALLTTLVFPSVLNAIKKSSNQTDKLSMDLISNAADLYIENNTNEFIKFNGNKYVIEIETLIDEGNLPSNIKISDIDNIDDACVQVSYENEFQYELKQKGTCEKLIQFDSICEIASDSTVIGLNAGAKYNCKVDPNRDAYTFYVLTVPTDNTINLIMDRNICEDGTPTAEGKTCLVAWISSIEYGCGEEGSYCATNDKGPVIAMKYLYNATKSWINIPPLNYTYNDKEFHGTTADNTSYTSFVSIDGVATIIALDRTITATIGSEIEPLRARMPIYTSNSTNSSKNEVENFNNNGYLFEYLDGDYWDYDNSKKPENNISGILGYWTLSSDAEYSRPRRAWRVASRGAIKSNGVDAGDVYGVRPVITIPIQL